MDVIASLPTVGIHEPVQALEVVRQAVLDRNKLPASTAVAFLLLVDEVQQLQTKQHDFIVAPGNLQMEFAT